MDSSDSLILFSLISMGFFGGFSHCIAMCGPLVVSQVTYQLAKTPLAEFKGFGKFKKIAIPYYHLGRITTYSFLGFLVATLRIKLDNNLGFKFFSAILLLIAIAFFIKLFISQNQKFFNFKFSIKTKLNHNFFAIKILQKSLRNLVNFLTKNLDFLLKNSAGLHGYFLGIILGFIPCGMLYGAISIAGSFSSPNLAFLGMMAFGSTTFIALFLVGFFTKFSTKLPEFKVIANIVIIINIIMLIKMFIKLLK
jgi:sulfite exporter TauE/SafE